jgi:hypothetical protein
VERPERLLGVLCARFSTSLSGSVTTTKEAELMEMYLLRGDRDAPCVLIDLKQFLEAMVDLKGSPLTLGDDRELMGRVA